MRGRRSFHTNLFFRSPKIKKTFDLFQKKEQYYRFLDKYFKGNNKLNYNKKDIDIFENQLNNQICSFLNDSNKKTNLGVNFSLLRKVDNKDLQSKLDSNSAIPENVKFVFNHLFMNSKAILYYY